MSKRALKRIPKIRERIRREEERLDYLYEKSTSLPSLGTDEKVEKSPTGDPTVIMDLISDLEDRIRKEKHRLNQLVSITELMIKRADIKQDNKEIMHLRYVKGYYWRQVADLMHYTLRQTHRKHEESLEKIFNK